MNSNPDESTKKPRKPRQSKAAAVAAITNDANNIDCSKIDTLHDEQKNNTNNDNASNTTIVKKPRAPRAKKNTPATAPVTNLDEIINHFDDDPPHSQPIGQHTGQNTGQSTGQTTEIAHDNIIKLPYKKPITHIYHLSDIHIQLYKRHQEYREVFQRVYNYLNAEKLAAGIDINKNTDIPFIVVITGDILHSKADLSPECIQLTYNFIKMLSSIMPVVLIAGNHDININNRDRLDSLTPILADLPSVHPVFYLLETGIYQLANILFYYSSILESKITIQPRTNQTKDNFVHIGLYHGRVNGAVYFNGIECQEPITSGNKTVTPAAFSEYDMTLLGDIHKHQFLTPNIAYAGSLIQQNIGEDITGHGLIKWSLSTHTGTHIPVANDWSYVNIHVDNKKASYLCTNPNGTHTDKCTLTKNISLRILYRNTPESYLADYITLMKMNHTIVDYRWNYDEEIKPTILELDSSNTNNSSNSTNDTENDSENNNAGNNGTENNGIGNDNNNTNGQNKNNLAVVGNSRVKSSLVDITNPEVQFTYLADIIRQNNSEITDADLSAIKGINIEQNRQLREINKQFNTNVFNGHYKILRIEFSNLFSFGESNVIEFKEFNGIVGIIAPNHLGKSSILDIIVYALFDEFTRKGSTKDIININREDFMLKMDLQIAEWIYTILKVGQRTKVGASVQVKFYRKHSQTGMIERLEEDNATKTKDRIMEYFGNYEDMIHTSFSIQHDNSCFIDSSNIKRKDELERIMRFEIVKKLYEQVNQRYNKDKAIKEHICKKVNGDEIIKLKKDKTKLKKLLDIIQSDRDYAKSRIKELNKTILEESNRLNKECDKFLKDNDETETQELMCSLEEELLDNETKLEELKSSIPSHNTDKTNNTSTSTLKTKETELAQVLTETNKKIKLLDQSLEKLYKSRKPISTKLPTPTPNSTNNSTNQDITLSSYLTELQNKTHSDMSLLDNAHHDVTQKIATLKVQEAKIQQDQEKILALEKKITKLPPELQSMLNNISNHDELEQSYLDNLECFIDFIITTINNTITNHSSTNHSSSSGKNSKRTPADFINTPEYNEYRTIAQQYYIFHALQGYSGHSGSGNGQANAQANGQANAQESRKNQIRTKQAELERDISVAKKLLEDLPKLEVQKDKIVVKQAAVRNQIKLLEMDIVNLESNLKLDEEIKVIKERRVKYETRIQTTETELQNIRRAISQLVEIDRLELEGRRLALDIKEAAHILEEFEKYRAQIEENKPIQERIAIKEAELREFEEVLELVDKRMQTEQAAFNKATTVLEQMKRDINEARELEAKLRLQEIYRNALKELPYILLSKIQPLLERKVNDLLAITTDFSVRFDMSDNKIDIYLDRAIYTDKSRAILINNASGFERFMASLAIRLALLELSNLPKINFIAIDEGWSSFDTHNINNVSVILDYLTSKFDFVLTISHLIQIKEHCDIQISLRRDELGFSKIIY